VGLGFLARDMLTGPRHVVSHTQQVRIIFFSPEASSVALIGDFNQWGQRDVTMAQSTDRGIWEFSVALAPGVYHYNLLVDGERWLANPKSSTLVPDGFGGYNSVLVVSEKCQDDCS
jgi:1,4-alpha-glucan branching enzyme